VKKDCPYKKQAQQKRPTGFVLKMGTGDWGVKKTYAYNDYNRNIAQIKI
jgi:hypothetical protein